MAETVRYLFSDLLGGIAVPLFFFISGFLFFHGPEWNGRLYLAKLRKRCRTLLVPYLLWNALWILIFYVAQSIPVVSEFFSGRNEPIRSYTFFDFLNAFYDYSSGHPILTPFWFIRDLMILVVLSPVVYWLVRALKGGAVLLWGIVWLVGLYSVPGFSPTGQFFFLWGAYFGIFGRDFVATFSDHGRWWCAGFLLLTAVCLFRPDGGWTPYLQKLNIVLGVATVIFLTAAGLKRSRIRNVAFLASASFFVYAAHEWWITFLRKAWIYALHPVSEVGWLACYFGQVAVILLLTLAGYALLRRWAPSLLAVITGGRR